MKIFNYGAWLTILLAFAMAASVSYGG